MTQFHSIPPRAQVPFEHAVRAYRASQEGMPEFGGRRARARKADVRRPVTAIADPSLAPAYEALWLQPGAPLPVVKAAYRSLAAQTHPDVGGDARAMLRINTAYETLRRKLE